jgi:hypothetical protein
VNGLVRVSPGDCVGDCDEVAAGTSRAISDGGDGEYWAGGDGGGWTLLLLVPTTVWVWVWVWVWLVVVVSDRSLIVILAWASSSFFLWRCA